MGSNPYIYRANAILGGRGGYCHILFALPVGRVGGGGQGSLDLLIGKLILDYFFIWLVVRSHKDIRYLNIYYRGFNFRYKYNYKKTLFN